MAAPEKKRGPMDRFVQSGRRSAPNKHDPPAYAENDPSPSLIPKSGFVSKLWETAVTNAKKRLPQELAQSDPADALLLVSQEAEARQQEAERRTRKIKVPGKDGKQVSIRDIYGGIVSAVKRFRDVGDIAAQADSAHLGKFAPDGDIIEISSALLTLIAIAVPWIIIRLCLTAGINEHEMYGVMIQGQEMCSGLVTHYIVIERVFVGEESDLVRAVQNALLALYTAIMDFLLEALKYFPPVPSDGDQKPSWLHKAASKSHRALRVFKNMDPTSQASVKGLLDKISGAKYNVDAAANHAYATMNMQALDGIEGTQNRIMGQLESAGLAEEERYRRLGLIMEEFKEPFHSMDSRIAAMYGEMEQRQAQSQRGRILNWLSAPGQGSRRSALHESLSRQRLEGSGNWLLEDPIYAQWQDAKTSSIAWVSGAQGTGKTNLLSLVIDRLQSQVEANNSQRLAIFYASAVESNAWLTPDDTIRDIPEAARDDTWSYRNRTCGEGEVRRA